MTSRRWIAEPVSRLWKMRLSAAPYGWVLEIEGVENPLFFSSRAHAQAMASRLGERLVRAGSSAELEISPRRNPFDADYRCIDHPDLSPQRRLRP
jgi:hypothetical protein